MKAIWKFPLEVTDRQVIEMPARAKIICVQTQRAVPCIWALCDLSKLKKEKRIISMYGTGHEHEKIDGKYIGTFQLIAKSFNGDLVFHVFEEIS